MTTGTQAVRQDRVGEWMVAEVPGAVAPFTFTHIAGGRSNLTYRVTDAGGRSWALRRPPLGGVLSTAHDMHREWRFLAAFAPTPVPVPRPVAFCGDHEVTGSDFYLMDFAEGRVLADLAAGHEVDPAVRRVVGESTVDVLAALHAVDPDGAGLGDLRRPGNSVQRQLKRWHRQAHQSAVQDLSALDAAHAALEAAVPEAPDAIVHGDYRAGNIVYRPDGTVVAVLDWELASIGDPMIDLGWLLASWGEPGDTVEPITAGPSKAGGYSPRAELAQRYAAATGRSIDGVGYYIAFARWRLACIAAGVYTRYASGVMADPDRDGSEELSRVAMQAEAALAELS